eukprot:TRINITY_DN13203_c0_g1_i2.p1 TRINITY_DN13203_c0_g1~~TRINITY_DN13203_c0_g1_i2.p1  ORF type:complete len:397 (+),score=91.13 TRINITY_DN13203_c0_g1_i2:46-1236(+)
MWWMQRACVAAAVCSGGCLALQHPLLPPQVRQQVRAATAAALCGSVVFSGVLGLEAPASQPRAAEWSVATALRPPPATALTEEQEIINDAWRVVKSAYVDKTFGGRDWSAERLKAIKGEYKTKDAAYTAAKAMLQTIGDPYTRFLTPNEYDTLAGLARGSTAMSSAGIGVEIVYLSDLARGPAAGSAGLGLDAVAARLRGAPGTDVRVTLNRAGWPVDVTVRRAKIKFQGLTDEMGALRGRPVGVITIKTFSKETARDLAAAVRRLQDAGATAFVVDLRHNPGGFFPGGIDAARVFLPAGCTIVSVVDRNGIGDTFATADDAAPLTDRPVVLVVDDRTASASEVFSAALKENAMTSTKSGSPLTRRPTAPTQDQRWTAYRRACSCEAYAGLTSVAA